MPTRIHKGTSEALQAHFEACLPKTLDDAILLSLSNDGITLESPSLPRLSTSFLSKDFLTLAHSLNKKLPLWRALGKHTALPEVYDCTSGFGRDSFMLATLGAKVTSIECNPLIFCILSTNIQAYTLQHPSIQWHAIFAESVDFLDRSPCPIDIAYIDPFFYKKSSSLPQKPIQWLQHLDCIKKDNSETLLKACLQHAHKTIIKSHSKTKFPFTFPKPHSTIEQKTTRFDIFLNPNASRKHETSGL